MFHIAIHVNYNIINYYNIILISLVINLLLLNGWLVLLDFIWNMKALLQLDTLWKTLTNGFKIARPKSFVAYCALTLTHMCRRARKN